MTVNNAVIGSIKLNKIMTGYHPGYLYGNVKIYEPNSLLRHIIHEIPATAYDLYKTLNKPIQRYLSNKYSVGSINEYLYILHSNKPNNGIQTSLDDERLFTNSRQRNHRNSNKELI